MAVTLLALTIGGVIGAAELAMACHLGLQRFAPHLIADNDYGDIFLVTAPVGALLGVCVTPAVACLRRVGLRSWLLGWLAATAVGVPVSFTAAMAVSFGPAFFIAGEYIVQWVALAVGLLLLHRAAKARAEQSSA